MLFDRLTASSSQSTELTTETITRIDQAAADEPLIRIRPFVDTDGLEAGPRFLRGLHTRPASTLRSKSAPVYAGEIWFHEGTITFHLRAPEPHDAIGLLSAHYPNSDTEVVTDELFPSVSPGGHAVACHLELRQDAAIPLKHLDSRPALEADAYRTILSQLIGADDETVMLQIVFMPVGKGWTRRGIVGRFGKSNVGSIAADRRKGHVQGYLEPEVVQSTRDSQAADDIVGQVGRPAFATTIRAVAIAPDPQTATHRLQRVADAVSSFDHEHTDQGLEPRFVPGTHVPAVLEAAAMRAHTPASLTHRILWGRPNVLTTSELAGLVHLPNDEVDIAAIDWTRQADGVSVPAATERFTGKSEATVGVEQRESPARSQPTSGSREWASSRNRTAGQRTDQTGDRDV
ncbi:hypothetical protein HWV07_11525 [Natronomonas salina]|uniref:hypothetical protein n=1 Tax=Natronomonas salina TaxID=1710540 RepID=UPI0015B69EAF|nr:hypothetical protein [Natronomonas salina]QLD89623.1 hypothetical protein HWV07_11525 [Natronomonas salina]